jgi:hypothetical protein
VIDIEHVIKEVSKNTGEDIDTVATVCKHVFLQLVNIMKDDDDTRDILLNHFLKFKLKRRYKENKSREYKIK